MSVDDSAPYDETERKAFVRYVAEMVEGFAADWNRLRREKGKRPWLDVVKVEIDGEYPDTVLVISRRDPGSGHEELHRFPFWKYPAFFDPSGKRLLSGREMASDIHMWIEGG